MAKAIFIGGTGSGVGKSWMATAVCRHLFRRGLRVAPFKAQNMSNKSFPCGGGEIGRAQVAQAEACRLEPEPDMNPILLKPTSNQGSQVVLNGKVWRNLRAREYYEHFDFFLQQVLDAYQRLAARFEVVVIEGAGSVAELNLKSRDLVNLGLAVRLDAPALLVSDIDRGGIFASLLGSFWLLPEVEGRLVRSFAVNRFRGDPTLFEDGVRILEERSARPCLGVFPFSPDLYLAAEDSAVLDHKGQRTPQLPGFEGRPRVGIVRLPHISNFTDFRLLPDACWISQPPHGSFDFIFLPGTKTTIDDLAWLRARGLDQWILSQHAAGATVIGICGGYQMLGHQIFDPQRIESSQPSAKGLGILPIETILEGEKVTRAVTARTPAAVTFSAYEIHAGRTTILRPALPFAVMEDGLPEGMRHERCIGTYLHGAFEHPVVLSEVLDCAVPDSPELDSSYDSLACWFESHVNLPLFEELYL